MLPVSRRNEKKDLRTHEPGVRTIKETRDEFTCGGMKVKISV